MAWLEWRIIHLMRYLVVDFMVWFITCIVCMLFKLLIGVKFVIKLINGLGQLINIFIMVLGLVGLGPSPWDRSIDLNIPLKINWFQLIAIRVFIIQIDLEFVWKQAGYNRRLIENLLHLSCRDRRRRLVEDVEKSSLTPGYINYVICQKLYQIINHVNSILCVPFLCSCLQA